MGRLHLVIAAAVLAASLQGLAWSAAGAAPPRGSLVIESTRDPMLHDEVWLVDMRSGSRRNLSRSPAMDALAAVSPDGRAVAFVSDRTGAPAVWVRRTTGGAAKRVAGPFAPRESSAISGLTWSPDGTELGFVVSPQRRIRIVRRAGGSGRWLGRRAGSLGWSPAGSRIAVGSAIDSGSPFVTIFDRRGRPLARVPGYLGSWSSRGALLVVSAERSWITDGNGRRTAALTNAGEGRWSPDGRILAVAGPAGLRLLTADGRLRLRRPGLALDEAGWAPDGRSLLVRDRSYRLARLFVGGDLRTAPGGDTRAWWTRGGDIIVPDFRQGGFLIRERGGTRRVGFPVPRGGCGGGWTLNGWADARRAVVTAGRGGQNPADLWVVSSDGGVGRRLLGGLRWDAGPEWSPDGNRLAYEEHEIHTHAGSCASGYQSSVAVARPDGSGTRLLPPPETITGGPRWSPDGTRIVAVRQSFGDEQEFGIVAADADVRAQLRLTTGIGDSPSWSSDGRSIVYQGDGAQIRRVPAAGGVATTVATGSLPEASPVAPVVAFVRDRALWVVGLDGAGARRLAALRPREAGYSPLRWSRDGRRIALADAGGVVVVAVAEGRMTRIARAGATSVTWSPDGRRIAFAAPVGRYSWGIRSEVFVASSAGGKPRRVTHDLADVGGISWRP